MVKKRGNAGNNLVQPDWNRKKDLPMHNINGNERGRPGPSPRKEVKKKVVDLDDTMNDREEEPISQAIQDQQYDQYQREENSQMSAIENRSKSNAKARGAGVAAANKVHLSQPL